jgi:hypothetical protein
VGRGWRSPFPSTLGRSAGTRLTSPPDGIPSSSKPLIGTRERRRCSNAVPQPLMSSNGPPRGLPIRRILPSFRLPTQRRQPDTARSRNPV